MGKFTPEMIERIIEEYGRVPVYKKVADKVGSETGTKIDERTVKKYVSESKKQRSLLNAKKDTRVAKSEQDVELMRAAMKMFRQGESSVNVAIALGMQPEKVSELREGFRKLAALDAEGEKEPGVFKINLEELSRKYSALDLELNAGNLCSLCLFCDYPTASLTVDLTQELLEPTQWHE